MKRLSYPPKVVRPAAEGIVPRSRLFDTMDEAFRGGHLWVSAPAGSGKTSMASSYLDARSRPSVWYQVDAGDADPASFFYYLRLALKNAFPRRRRSPPLLTPEYLPHTALFAQRFFEEFFSLLPPASVVVFDNYHELPPGSSLHELFAIGLAACPEHVRIVVLSREEPPPSVARLVVEGKFRVIGWEELRLTRSEADEMQKKGTANVSRLYSVTEGWVAGLVFLLGRPGQRDDPRQLPDYTQVFRYFSHEVVDRLDRDTVTFLIVTAVLPIVTPPVAKRLTGMADADRILRELHARNCFIERAKARERAYRYHPLFREFLLAQAAERYPEGQRRETMRKAAELLAATGQEEDAAALFAAAGDHKGLASLVLDNAPALTAQGRYATLERWLEGIPQQVRECSPWLLYWSGVCRMPFDSSGAKGLLENAFHLFESSGQTEGTLRTWAGVVDAIVQECDDYTPLDHWIGWLDGKLRAGLAFPSSELETQVVISMAGALIWRQPDHPGLKQWVERALALSSRCPSDALRIQALLNAGIYYLWYDDKHDALVVVEKLRKAARSGGKAPQWSVALKCVESMVLMTFAGQSGRALRTALEGFEIARKTGVRVWEHFLYGTGFHAALGADDMPAAADLLARMESAVTERQRVVAGLFRYTSAWYHFLHGRLQLAAVHSRAAVEIMRETGTPFPELMARYLSALILRAMGAKQGAKEQLQAANALLARVHSPLMGYLLLLAEAEFALEEGRREAGLGFLREAMAAGRREGHTSLLFHWRPAAFSRLCAEALEHGIESDHVRRLITGLHLLPDEAARGLDDWPWRFKVRTLGRFGVEKAGEPLVFDRKVPRKPLEMLEVLIALGGTEVMEHLVADALWPDAEGDLAHRSLKIGLHRLRQLLDRNDAVIAQNGRLSLNPVLFWTDCSAFQQLTDRADALWQSGERAGAATAYERAVALYQGQFLPHAGDWAVPLRERLKARFVHCASRWGKYLEDCGNFESALDLYQTGIERDELAESLWAGLIRCLLALGRRAEAVTAFKRLRDILRSHIGIEPSNGVKRLLLDLTTT